MKKILLVLGVAAAAMTSCTSDEVVEMNQSNLIKFESFVNKSTRAVTEINSLTNFYVFGGYTTPYNNVFNNTLIGSDGKTTAEWTANIYKFAAYTNAATNDGPSGTDVSFDGTTLKFPDYVVSDANDLIAAAPQTVDNTSLNNPNVSLTFKHMLAQVKFTFTNEDNSHKLSVSKISVAGVKNQGTGSIVENGTISWSSLDVVNDYSMSYESQTVSASGTYAPEFQMVIPQDLTNIKISFTVSFIDSNEEVVSTETFNNISLIYDNETETPTNNFTAWQPGYRYNYTASFPSDPKTIQFNVIVDDWEDKTASGNNELPGDDQMDF